MSSRNKSPANYRPSRSPNRYLPTPPTLSPKPQRMPGESSPRRNGRIPQIPQGWAPRPTISPPPEPQSWAGEYMTRRDGANPQIPQGWTPSPPFYGTNRRDSTNQNGLYQSRSRRDSPTRRDEDYHKYFIGKDMDDQPMRKKEIYENINSWIKELDMNQTRQHDWKNRLQSTPPKSMLIGRNGDLKPFPFDPTHQIGNDVEDLRATYLRNRREPRPSPPKWTYSMPPNSYYHDR